MIRNFSYTMIVMLSMIICPLQGQEQPNCFLKDFEPKVAAIPAYTEIDKPSGDATVTVTINFADRSEKVSRYLYGNNANTYMTQMITEPQLIGYLRLLSPQVIRYPGGNLSSLFFWNALKNQAPGDAPAQLIDGNNGNPIPAGYWYGKNNESWTLSVDNYYKMLEMTHSTGIITVNYSYARYGTGPEPVATAAKYAADWVRYDNGRTKFWEIGNENHGPWQAGFRIDTTKNQDGQPEIISGALYGQHFLVFADSMRQAAKTLGATIYIGAQLIQYDARSSWNPPERDWNKGFFSQAGNAADFFIVHSYYTPYNQNSTAAVILNSATAETNNMMNYMKQTTSENNVLLKPVALTEWNIFAVGSRQSCSFINGMHAALVLGALANNNYGLAARWNLANGYDNGNDHGLFSQGDEPGVPKWNPRPAFFYLYYFQKFFGDHVFPTSVSGSKEVLAYASTFVSGQAGVVVVNKGTAAQTVKLNMKNYGCGERYYIYSLIGGEDNGEFSQVVSVNGYGPNHATGGPIDELENIEAYACSVGAEIKFISPARSVQFILIESGNTYLSVKDEQRQQKESNTPDRIAIYPNPAKDDFRLSWHKGIFKRIDIYDILGRVVYSKHVNPAETSLNLQPDLPAGVYFVKLHPGREFSIKKVVICN